jgi:PAS domain S-box-containing protein
VPIPVSPVLDGAGRDPDGPALLLCEPQALEPLRGIVGDRARAAVICPVPPPAPDGVHDLFLLAWFQESFTTETERGHLRSAASELAARIPDLLRDGASGPAREPGSFRRVLREASQGLILVRPDSSVIWSNAAGERGAGLDTSLTPGEPLFDRISESATIRLRSLMEVSSAGAWASEEIEFGVEGLEPRLQHVLVDAVSYENEEAYLIALRGLTERDRLVDLLRREKEFTRSLLEAANACVLGLDLQGRTILFNRVFQDVAEYRLADVLGRDAVEILVPEPRRSAWRDSHLKALSGSAVTDRDFNIRTRQGEEKVLCLSAGRINDAGGAARGVLWTGRDVTEERRREKALRIREESTSCSLSQLKEFSRISSIILQEKSLDNVCRMFVEALSKVSTFRRAILTLCDADFRGYKWYFAGLTPEEQEIFYRNKMTQRERVTIFQERFRLGNSYYIPHTEEWHYEGVRSQAPSVEMVDWHPDDFMFIPLYGTNRTLVGAWSCSPTRWRTPSRRGSSTRKSASPPSGTGPWWRRCTRESSPWISASES